LDIEDKGLKFIHGEDLINTLVCLAYHLTLFQGDKYLASYSYKELKESRFSLVKDIFVSGSNGGLVGVLHQNVCPKLRIYRI
jgi:hypothetical protein